MALAASSKLLTISAAAFAVGSSSEFNNSYQDNEISESNNLSDTYHNNFINNVLPYNNDTSASQYMEVNSYGSQDPYEYSGLTDDIAHESKDSEISTKLKEINDIESQIEFMKDKLSSDLEKIKEKCREFDQSKRNLMAVIPYFSDLAVSYFDHPVEAFHMHDTAMVLSTNLEMLKSSIQRDSKKCQEDLKKLDGTVDETFLKESMDKLDTVDKFFEVVKKDYQKTQSFISERIIGAAPDEKLAKSWGKFQEVTDKCASTTITAGIETVDTCRQFIKSHEAAQSGAK